VLGVDARERHGQVVAQGGVGEVLLEDRLAALQHAAQRLAAVEHAEDELVALVAVLAHQRLEALHGRGLEGVEAVPAVDAADDVEDVLAAPHVAGQEVARALGGAVLILLAMGSSGSEIGAAIYLHPAPPASEAMLVRPVSPR
jgi:cysteine synthase